MNIGIDIGGSHIAIALVDESGKIKNKIETDIRKRKNVEEYIVDYVNKGIEKQLKTADKIEKIGIAVPGNPAGTIITNLVNLGIDKIDLKSVEEKYKIKIKTINDAKAAAIAEKTYGALKGIKDGAFLCIGTGIGGAVFLNDNLLIANRNPGFELGHMIIKKDGIQCKCGKKGCFETYCSMKRLKNKLKKQLKEIEKLEKIESISLFKELLIKHLDHPSITKLIDKYIDNFIIGLSNIIDIFEPETICIGGSFVYFEEILYKKLIDEFEKRKYVFNKDKLPKIVLAKLQNDAGIIGATLI